MKSYLLIITLITYTCIFWQECSALNNGLALRPTMAWMTYRQDTSEDTIIDMADRMASQGYRKLGYLYVILEVLNITRSTPDKLQILQYDKPGSRNMVSLDTKELANYVHRRGLKFGLLFNARMLYGETPQLTDEDTMKKDVETISQWDVDYMGFMEDREISVKDALQSISVIGKLLNQTHRRIEYSCAFDDRIMKNFTSLNMDILSVYCNSVFDSYDLSNPSADGYALYYARWKNRPERGHWGVPSAFILENTTDATKTKLAMLAILASPLMVTYDEKLFDKREYEEILKNEGVIEIDQDRRAIQGCRVLQDANIEVWTRPVIPVVNGNDSFAVAVVNREKKPAEPKSYSVSLNELGLDNPKGYDFVDLYSPSTNKPSSFVLLPDQQLKVDVVAEGVKFFKATALP